MWTLLFSRSSSNDISQWSSQYAFSSMDGTHIRWQCEQVRPNKKERFQSDSSFRFFFRRICIPEAFLTADIILFTLQNIFEGLVVYPKVSRDEVRLQLKSHPLIELGDWQAYQTRITLHGYRKYYYGHGESLFRSIHVWRSWRSFPRVQVAAGGNRQECHERIRQLSQKAAEKVKIEGLDNDLVERVKNDPYFSPIVNKLDVILDAKTFIGRAPEQVRTFSSPFSSPCFI